MKVLIPIPASATRLNVAAFGTEHLDVADSSNNGNARTELAAFRIESPRQTQHAEKEVAHACVTVTEKSKPSLEMSEPKEKQAEELKCLKDEYEKIGMVYEDQGKYERAREYYQKALEITIKVLGPVHIDVADS